jgi:hypothetical protein
MLDEIAANTPSDWEIEERRLCWWCYGPLDDAEWKRVRELESGEQFNLHCGCVAPLADIIEEVGA